MTTEKNIAAHLPAMAVQQPEALAVAVQRARRGGVYTYRQYTLDDLNRESDRIAHGLEGIGIGRGVRTVLMVTPSLEFFALTFALFKVGAVPVLVDPGMGIKNLKKCLDEAEPKAFVGIPKAHAARVLLGWAERSIDLRVTVGRRWFWGGWTLEHLRQASDAPYSIVQPEPGEMAAILFTSGSTGTPKGVVYTHEIFNAQVDILKRQYGIVPGERDLATFPLFALFGPALGMAAVVPDMDASKPASANPAHIVAAIEEHQCTNMFVSPALIEVVGRHAEDLGIQLPSVKRVISAGAPANLPSLKRFSHALTGAAEVYPSYGATESLPVASIALREQMQTEDQTNQGAGVCVGKPVDDVTVRVIQISDQPIEQWSDALVLPPGEVGEIAVRGTVVTREYFRKPEATAMAKIPEADGGGFWHRMGDLGYIDDAGRLWMCGRKAHRVVTSDRTYFTIPCERVLNVHPRVRRTALVGVPRDNDVWPVLCVEAEPGLGKAERAEVWRELLEMADQNPHTQGIVRLLFHRRFPVDVRHNAKIFREKLAQWAEEKLR